MNLDLKNKKAIVCGSTQGIGKAIAIELANMGASVTLVARNEESLKKVKAELNTGTGQVHSYMCVDFTHPEKLKSLLEAFMSRNTPVHILINNTGGPPGGPINSAKVEEFISAFNNHLVCNHILVQACMEGMKNAGYGRIINVISTSVKQPLPNLGVSNTIRAAVGNWSKTLANELGKFNITVNNVLPGATSTQRLETIINTKATKNGLETSVVKAEMLHEIPMGRFADASEIAAAVAFLASPSASYINGINLPVDGGRTSSL
ncbi:MAG TPA: SDR family oxidoreductase [Bacteroidia bacterium]|jgi:3-oxoacyl-[acyl-carrier protein] reductase|nr:SDR family oxidoreductase [Bacteroidia bacterium]